ncbi:MAG: NAD(P)/FAD-dependent oxidoreductase [Proteobacteria bacterium]|nr:NAD(P)/FAD-dependent oxidoreductase [Pseudomonadota bacterium]
MSDDAPRQRLVVVGNGMAGIRTVEELLALAPDQYAITVFGAEPHPNYNRILLSPVLAGEKTFADIVINDFDWYARHGIRLLLNRTVVNVDRARRLVVADDGTAVPYDRLLIATGSTPFIPPIPGHGLPGVLAYRAIEDTDAMIEAARVHRHAVVIGGGLLGLEAANGLKRRGMDVTVVHLADWLMERQLDDTAAALLQQALESRGIAFRTHGETRELVAGESGRVAAVRLADGETLPAELVVMAVGIRPNTALAEAAGLACQRGILVSDTMQTYDPRIYAVGECVAHRGVTYGLVAPLYEQARVCANHLAALGYGRYAGSVTSTKLKVTGVDVFSAGDYMGGDGTEAIVLHDAKGSVYRKLVLKDDRIVGGVLVGDTTDSGWYFQMLREGRSVAEWRHRLLLGRAGCVPGETGSDVASLPDTTEICGCNGVCKGKIVGAITTQKLTTLDDVRKHTKASSSCGSCTGQVEALLAATLGGSYKPADASRKPLCACTGHTHEEVRAAIREQKLLTIPEAMEFLGWNSPDGCATCRPALNYYLVCAWPHEAVDDAQSRFVNERVHANIQKDGTYSVVPRMYGGVTTPDQLRRIADVADKYRIPTVKVTGGQRIDLLGVRKEDLPRVWADLDMPSGYAYAKALRTVKTCVGSEWCRFGVQDSTNMGIDLEHAFDRMWTPHKVKMAVSGCPRNCAESGIKDVGIIGVESGWEIHVAGNGGIRTEVAQLLCKVKTRDEVLEYAGAFLQLYREEARYLDRTVHWVRRVGLDYVKQRVVDDADGRRALYARLLDAVAGQPDPWAARAEGAQAREFAPIAP